jgi:uncharacterized membrane protein YkvA (DUF1232 family)
MLLARLAGDRRIDRRRRLAAAGAFAYAVSSFDLIPEAVPVVGKVDDLLVAVLALRILLDGADEDLPAEHWERPAAVLEGFDRLPVRTVGLVPRRVQWALSRVVGR